MEAMGGGMFVALEVSRPALEARRVRGAAEAERADGGELASAIDSAIRGYGSRVSPQARDLLLQQALGLRQMGLPVGGIAWQTRALLAELLGEPESARGEGAAE